jgi:pyridoxal phosphate enzyme (YggS family)
VRRRIISAAVSAGREPAAITLIAVTKTHPLSDAAAAVAGGVVDLGENRAQELWAKAGDPGWDRSSVAPHWHLIGQCQTNKVARLAPLVHLWHSVDRVDLADEIARRSDGARILVQVDTSGAPGRGGAAPAEVATLVDHCRGRGLDVRGLMSVAPLGADPRGCFDTVVALADRLDLEERSLGMTDDYEIAVEHGSTMVRVGRAIFGARS